MGELFGIAIVRPFGLILMAIFKAVHSYGLAVILFALAVKLVCIPLAIKGKKSMLAMTALNNELQQLQKKYANNRVKLNEEMQKLYDKHGVSPMSGCLPQFIPFPIMMGLYYAVQQPMKFMMGFTDDVIAQLATAVGMDPATMGFYGQITLAEKLSQLADANGNFPENIMKIAEGAGELVKIDFNFLGLDLSQIPSIKNPSILWLIPILSGVTAYLSSFIMRKMQGTQTQNNMNALFIMMPLMSVYFGFILPGAIGIYWIFNNVFSCVQEIILTKILRSKREGEQRKEAENEARIAAEKEAGKAARQEANRAIQQKQSQEAKKKGDRK